MNFQLTDGGELVFAGALQQIQTPVGDQILESKEFFSHEKSGFFTPVVIFGDGTRLRLHHTRRGFAASEVIGGCRYGVNLNKIGSSGRCRWGLTAWCSAPPQAAPAPRRREMAGAGAR